MFYVIGCDLSMVGEIAAPPIFDHKSFRMALLAFFNLSRRFSKWLFDVSASSNFSKSSRCLGEIKNTLNKYL